MTGKKYRWLKIIVILHTVVVCTETKRDHQSHGYFLLWQSLFFCVQDEGIFAGIPSTIEWPEIHRVIRYHWKSRTFDFKPVSCSVGQSAFCRLVVSNVRQDFISKSWHVSSPFTVSPFRNLSPWQICTTNSLDLVPAVQVLKAAFLPFVLYFLTPIRTKLWQNWDGEPNQDGF